MILLHLSHENYRLIEEIAEILLREKLVTDINIIRNIDHLTYKENKLKRKITNLLTAKSKALLFPTIDTRIRKICKKEIPEIYTTAIVHMDWEQSQQLGDAVKQV